MNYLIEEIEYKNHTIKIYQDESALNPIKEWDMLGTFSCFHRDYDLSCNKNTFDTGEELMEYFEIEKNNIIKLPLKIYEHGGISISASVDGSFGYPYNDQWDSSSVGYIHVHKDKIREEYGCKRISKKIINKVKEYLLNEVKEFNQYLTGDVCGFVVEGELSNDSCWGFFGRDGYHEAIAEAKGSIDYAVEEQKIKHFDKLKKYIINKVPFVYREPFDKIFI